MPIEAGHPRRESRDEPLVVAGELVEVSRPETSRGSRGRLRSMSVHRGRLSLVGWSMTLVAMLIGAALRFREYIFDRSLWLDEATLALSIVNRSFSGLTKPLYGGQTAPIPWLWAERAAVKVFGNTEWALRLLPFLASLMSLVAFVAVARYVLSPLALSFASLAFACSPWLIRYSVEVKQYGTDVLCVLLVAWAALRYLEQPARSTALVWAGTSAGAMWFSHASLLAAAGSAVIVVLSVVRKPSRIGIAEVWPALLIVAASAVMVYLAFVRRTSADPALHSYWASGFAPKPVRLGSTLHWLADAWVEVTHRPGELAFGALALITLIAAQVVLMFRKPWQGGLVLALAGVVSVAAVAGKYPLSDRLVLWIVPFLIILLAQGVDLVAEVPQGWRLIGSVTLAAASLVVVAPLANGLKVFSSPIDITDSRGPYEFVNDHMRSDDAVLVESPWTSSSINAYYAPRYGLNVAGRFYFSPRTPCEDATQLARLKQFPRFWVILTHHPSGEPVDRTAVYLSRFKQVGELRRSFRSTGDAGAYMFATHEETVEEPARDPWVPGSCLTVSIP
jgi:Dolichyl-phosphate-mannose-protein mannosyltransferase